MNRLFIKKPFAISFQKNFCKQKLFCELCSVVTLSLSNWSIFSLFYGRILWSVIFLQKLQIFVCVYFDKYPGGFQTFVLSGSLVELGKKKPQNLASQHFFEKWTVLGFNINSFQNMNSLFR